MRQIIWSSLVQFKLLKPVRHQAITWNNIGLLPIEWNSNQNPKIFFHEDSFEMSPAK